MPSSGDRTEFQAIREATRSVYRRQAATFDRQRPRVLFEKPWLDRFLQALPAGGTILDAGCGAGEPLARYMIERGYRVTGLDFSEPMLEIARGRFPSHHWHLADMRNFDLGKRFDGVVGWDSFFHLSMAEQRQVIPRLARHTGSRGSLLLTVGPAEGEVTGTVGGETVYHASLSPEEYRRLLTAEGFDRIDFVPDDPDCEGHSVILATRG